MKPSPERSLQRTRFMGWPAFALRQGRLTLHVVPSIGGRLMGIAFDGVELCFVNQALRGKMPSDDPATWAALCGDWSFPLWGGGKTWLAPESAWPGGTPHRDLDSGPWDAVESWCKEHSMGIEVMSPVCHDSGLQLTRRLTLPARGSAWRVEHVAINRGPVLRTVGLWDVLMLKRPARVSLPQPGGMRALPGKPSLEVLAQEDLLHRHADRIDIDCDSAREFKLGFDSQDGLIRAEWPTPEGRLRYERRSQYPSDASFAHGHPLELFNAPRLHYFEIETHSPLAMLPPGGACEFAIEEAVLRPPATPEGDSP